MPWVRLIQPFLILFTYFAAVVHTASHDLRRAPRDTANTTTPLVNALVRIRDRNGLDISSSFQIKVYRHSRNTQTTNITKENNLNDRQVATDVIRIINDCPLNETFVESHCTPNEGEEASLQAFVYTCSKVVDHWRTTTGEFMGQAPLHRSRAGHCEPIAMCVDGYDYEQIASCVHSSLFDDYTTDKEGNVKGMLFGEVFDVAKVFALFSTKTDEKTQIETNTMRVEAWDSSAALGAGGVQTTECRGCAELETGLLPPKTDSLRVEATLVSAGAVAGILWLALTTG